MTVSFDIPSDLEASLRDDVADLGAEAKEAFLVSLYRQGRLSHLALSRALGLDRFETDDVLHKYHVTEDLGSTADYLADAKTLQKLRATKSS